MYQNSTCHLDQELLRKGFLVQAQIHSLCYDYSVVLFREPRHLQGKL